MRPSQKRMWRQYWFDCSYGIVWAGETACSLALPCHALPCPAMPCRSQSQIPKSFLVVIRPAWNMIGTVYLLDRPLQAPTILPDLKDTVEE